MTNRDDINIVLVLKAMGAESDQEVMQLVAGDEQMEALMIPTIQDCKGLSIFTQGQVRRAALPSRPLPLTHGVTRAARCA